MSGSGLRRPFPLGCVGGTHSRAMLGTPPGNLKPPTGPARQVNGKLRPRRIQSASDCNL